MADELSKQYYKIGDVSELLELTQSTIRFWEREFSELSPRRSERGVRRYTPSDIEVLRVIKFLIKDKGLTIEGAREHLRRNRYAVDKRHQTIQRLQEIRRSLTDLLDALEKRGR